MKGTEKLNNIMRKKQAIHTVRYTREKLVSSTGQCYEKKGAGAGEENALDLNMYTQNLKRPNLR